MTERKVVCMSSHELDALVPGIKYMKSWIESVETELAKRISAGEEFQNAAMVSKQTRTIWVEEDQVLGIIRTLDIDLDEVAPRKLLTPLQMTKILGKDNFENSLSSYTERRESAPSLSLGKKSERPSVPGFLDLED